MTMKKAILFTLLFLSVNVYGQSIFDSLNIDSVQTIYTIGDSVVFAFHNNSKDEIDIEISLERKKENGNWEEALPAIFVYDSQWRLIKDRDKLKEQVMESKNNGEIGCIIEANKSYILKWPIMEFMEDDGPAILYRFNYKLRRSSCGDSVRLYSNPFQVLPKIRLTDFDCRVPVILKTNGGTKK